MDKDKFYRELAEEELLQYHDLKRMNAHGLPVEFILPLILSNDLTPKKVKEERERQIKIKKNIEDKLIILESSVEQLEEKYRNILKMKYFERRSDGNLNNDYYVQSELKWSRSHYFRLKKQALIEVGKLLNAHYLFLEKR